MRKVIVCLTLVMVLLLSSFAAVYARQPDDAYTYDGTEAVPSTNAYQVKVVIDETVTGTTAMKSPTDIFVDKQDRTFILDAGNCRILVLDDSYKCIKELQKFTYTYQVEGETKVEELTLAEGAQGLFYRESNGYLYIADTNNDRIIVSDLDGKVIRVHLKPVSELLNAEDPFRPEKIIVDNMGIMYVTSGRVNTGALLIDSENNFLSFYGINKIKATAEILLEYFWRSILPDSMNDQSGLSFQPVEFNNLFWSDDRFVYAVSPLNDSVESAFVKLNALGKDVAPNKIDFSGYINSAAMENTGAMGAAVRSMKLEDLTVDDEGAISIIERSSGRIFQFDANCNLLCVFGGKGYQKGSFTNAVSIESDTKNNLLILDSAKNSVTVMEQTFYGQMIREANRLFNEGLYEESVEPWKEVLRMNANYTQAYVGMGKAYMSMGEYEEAMKYFQLGDAKSEYAEAKAALREEWTRANFAWIAAIVVILMVVVLAFDQVKALCFTIGFWIGDHIGKKKK